MYCGKLATLWFSLTWIWWSMYWRKLTALCVLWKTYCHRTFRRQTFDIVCTVKNLLHCMCCGKLTALCVLWLNLLSSYVSTTWYWYRVYCGKLTVKNLLTLSCIMYRGKLTDIIVYDVPWKTYSLNTLRQHTFDIIMYCEKLTV